MRIASISEYLPVYHIRNCRDLPCHLREFPAYVRRNIPRMVYPHPLLTSTGLEEDARKNPGRAFQVVTAMPTRQSLSKYPTGARNSLLRHAAFDRAPQLALHSRNKLSKGIKAPRLTRVNTSPEFKMYQTLLKNTLDEELKSTMDKILSYKPRTISSLCRVLIRQLASTKRVDAIYLVFERLLSSKVEILSPLQVQSLAHSTAMYLASGQILIPNLGLVRNVLEHANLDAQPRLFGWILQELLKSDDANVKTLLDVANYTRDRRDESSLPPLRLITLTLDYAIHSKMDEKQSLDPVQLAEDTIKNIVKPLLSDNRMISWTNSEYDFPSYALKSPSAVANHAMMLLSHPKSLQDLNVTVDQIISWGLLSHPHVQVSLFKAYWRVYCLDAHGINPTGIRECISNQFNDLICFMNRNDIFIREEAANVILNGYLYDQDWVGFMRFHSKMRGSSQQVYANTIRHLNNRLKCLLGQGQSGLIEKVLVYLLRDTMSFDLGSLFFQRLSLDSSVLSKLLPLLARPQ